MTKTPVRNLRGVATALETASEWRKVIWRRWLLTQLARTEDEEPRVAGATEREAGATPREDATELPAVPPVPAVPAAEAEPQRSVTMVPEPNDATSGVMATAERKVPPVHPEGFDPSALSAGGSLSTDDPHELRRAALRSRFDALCDRFFGVEAALDTLGHRLRARELAERQAHEHMVQLLEHLADAAERQTAAIEALSLTAEHLERRLDAIERTLRSDRLDHRERRDTHRAALSLRALRGGGTRSREEPSNGDEALKAYGDVHGSGYPSPLASGADGNGGSSLTGNLGELSLATVLSMFELERRTGALHVRSEDAGLVSFEFVDGVVVGCRMNELEVEAVEALRRALQWSTGRFWFRPGTATPSHAPPRSVGSLLLEATHQNDEAVR